MREETRYFNTYVGVKPPLNPTHIPTHLPIRIRQTRERIRESKCCINILLDSGVITHTDRADLKAKRNGVNTAVVSCFLDSCDFLLFAYALQSTNTDTFPCPGFPKATAHVLC